MAVPGRLHNFGQPDFAVVCMRVHMNGRVYEPKLGRMLSPDPVTQAPENGQNYNRYSYALNNPLKYTDPSGYIADPATGYVVATIANSVFAALGNAILGVGNKCDADCQWRRQADAWCKSTTSCTDAMFTSRRTRDNKDFKNGNNAGLNIPYVQYAAFQAAQAGDKTFNGFPSDNKSIVGNTELGAAADTILGVLKSTFPEVYGNKNPTFVTVPILGAFGAEVFGYVLINGGYYGKNVDPDQLAQFISTIAHETMHVGVPWGDPSRRGRLTDDTPLDNPHLQIDDLSQQHMLDIYEEVKELLFGDGK